MSDEQGAPPFDLGALFGQVMDQASKVQDRMTQAQDRLKTLTAEGSAGGELVKVVATGDRRIKSIRIDKVAVDPRDVEMLEDLLVAGVNDALRRVTELTEQEMGQVTGGLDVGGALGSLGDLLGGGGGGPFGGGEKE